MSRNVCGVRRVSLVWDRRAVHKTKPKYKIDITKIECVKNRHKTKLRHLSIWLLINSKIN